MIREIVAFHWSDNCRKIFDSWLHCKIFQCTWCGVAQFCSEAHLAVHRPSSKCLPFKVSKIEKKGRGLVAARPIRARETVLTESPALSGPSLMTTPVCPTCLAPTRVPILPCSRCSLPVCSPVCEQSPVHQHECRLLSENKVNTCFRLHWFYFRFLIRWRWTSPTVIAWPVSTPSSCPTDC